MQDLTADLTKNLTDSEKLDLILTRLARLEFEFTDLRAWREDRSRDTRPMLELVHKEIADTRLELAEVHAKVSKFDRKLESLVLDVNDVRVEQRGHEKRLAVLERGVIQ